MTIDTLICVHSKDTDHDAMLQDGMRSVLENSVKPNNLVVVYDACWGHTQEYIENWLAHRDIGSVKYIPVAKTVKQGLAVAKNFGLKFCTSDWITYCDADDRWMNSKLEIQSKWCEEYDTDFCFTQSWDIRPDGILVPNCFPVGYAENHEHIAKKIFSENCLCHGSAMIKRSAIEVLGGYNTDRKVLGMEDWDLWKSAFIAGYKFHNIPERLYCYRLGSGVAR